MSNKQTEAGFGVILALIIGLLLNIVTGGSFIPLGPAWFFLIIAVLIQFVLAITTDLKAARRLFIFISVVILLGATVLWIHPFSFGISNDTSSQDQSSHLYLTSKKADFFDPLSSDKGGGDWRIDAAKCIFADNMLHVLYDENQISGVNPPRCYPNIYSSKNNYLSNFILEVQTKIIQGTCFTISFRDDTINGGPSGPVSAPNRHPTLYELSIYQDGTYNIDAIIISSTPPTPYVVLASNSSSAFNKGLNQLNTIALVIKESTFTLYINHQKVIDVDVSSSYSQGDSGEITLGQCAVPSSGPTDVAYSNFRIWKL